MKTPAEAQAQLKLFGPGAEEGKPLEIAGAQRRRSAFDATGFRETIAQLQDEIRSLYTADDVPWIVSYSGGKDSTATLQLIWTAVAALPVGQRRNPILGGENLSSDPIRLWPHRNSGRLRPQGQRSPGESALLVEPEQCLLKTTANNPPRASGSRATRTEPGSPVMHTVARQES